MMTPDRISKIKARAKRNALLATKAAKPLLPEDAEPDYIIALANEMLRPQTGARI
jgi:ribosome biogenesis SPOUT family RNA methylase Rps3